ncbi:MAG: DEAD/DEAH box helicase [Candidatus Heimdallarchaeaceae archaeon]
MREKLTTKIFNDSINKLREIFIWNRALSEITGSSKIINAEQFLKEELFEIKGPYIEYVARPKQEEKEFRTFCEELKLEDSVIKAFEKVLFGRSKFNKLYKHQSEFIKSVILNSGYDYTLSVPTAAGKTEAFLIPILDECVKSQNNKLKAILFYPTKTLAIDQFNRIIKYVNEVNKNLENRVIKIGIWDGDTKYEVNKDPMNKQSLRPESIIRGIKCPECGTKLKITYSERIYCPDCDFDSMWIRATRKAIKGGVDILLTNPEAFDFLFVDPNKDKISIVGENTYNDHVKYVVFDEAHYWTGASGAAIHMLCQRLRFFYGNDLKIFVVSATIKEPKDFGEKLTGRKNISIWFSPEVIEYDKSQIDLYKIPVTYPEKSFRLLYEIIKNQKTTNGELNEKKKKDIALLELLGYIQIEDETRYKWKLNNLRDLKDKSFEEFLESYEFRTDLKERVISRIPEILLLRDFLSSKRDKPITFTHLLEIHEKFTKELDRKGIYDDNEIETVTNSLLTIGRLAGLLQDRFHYFIRGNDGIYYCDNCKTITSKKICSKCGNVLSKRLYFCSTCHNIFYGRNLQDEFISDEAQNEKFELETDLASNGVCNRCGSNIQRTYSLRDGSVFHPQLLSQFLSVYGRESNSKKILVFGDSRNLAERIGYDFSENDYRLVAQRFMLSILETPLNAYELYSKTLKFIDNCYYYPIINSLKDRASRENWKRYRESKLKHFVGLNNATMLIDGCLITPTCVLEESNNDIQAILGHILFKYLITRGRFSKKGLTFDGYTLEKVLDFDLKFSINEIIHNLPFVIKYLYENNFISFIKKEVIEALIREKTENEETVNELIEYFNEQTRDLNEILEEISFSVPKDCYGIFDRKNRILGYNEARKNDYKISKVNKVSLCKFCKKAFPLIDSSNELCPLCKGQLIKGDRSKNNGFLPDLTSVGIPYDYWAKQLASENNEKIETLAINVHRAGIPQELRSVIEDSFKQENPKINIISATTTFELGIDIGDLDTIFLVGLPPGIANYIQRAGRAGRSQGHSSIVLTFIRSGNVIDDFYFGSLKKRYFDAMPKIGIPDNSDVEIIFACNIVTLISSYLARNYDSKDIYKKIWDVNFRLSSLSTFISQNLKRSKLFSMLIREKKAEEINRIVKECYGIEALELKKKIEMDNDDLSLIKRVYDHFSYYRLMKKLPGESQDKLAEDYRFFSQILSSIGYLANYRGFIETMPIQTDKKIILEHKSVLYAITENYPGIRNNNSEQSGRKYSGGYQLISMTPYITDKVRTTKKILDTKICNNLNCKFYQLKADIKIEKCVFCGEELATISIYSPEEIIVKSLPRDLGYRASPNIVKDIEFQEINKKSIQISNNLEIQVFKTIANLITFVPSFSFRTRSSTNWISGPSEAEIPEDIVIDPTEEKLDFEGTFDELLESFSEERQSKKRKYVHVGYSLYTRACAFDFPFSLIIEEFTSIDTLEQREKTKIAIFESTFEMALTKSITLVVGCDINDFSILTVHYDKGMRFTIADNCEGGNGISDSVYTNLKEIIQTCYDVVRCNNCNSFCKRCILIDRVPNYMMENNLLDRIVVEQVLRRYLPAK